MHKFKEIKYRNSIVIKNYSTENRYNLNPYRYKVRLSKTNHYLVQTFSAKRKEIEKK